MTISLILAHDDNYGIGINNSLPWHISDDLKWFKSVTAGKTVVMGRKTHESLGCKPLPNRRNIVVSTLLDSSNKIEVINNLNSLPDDDIFIIGGSTIYQQAMQSLPVKFLYITRIKGIYETDTKFEYCTKDFRLDYQINKRTHSFLRFSNTQL